MVIGHTSGVKVSEIERGKFEEMGRIVRAAVIAVMAIALMKTRPSKQRVVGPIVLQVVVTIFQRFGDMN